MKPVVSIHVQGANRILTIRTNQPGLEVRVIDDEDDWSPHAPNGAYTYDEAVAKHDELPIEIAFKVIYYKADIESEV